MSKIVAPECSDPNSKKDVSKFWSPGVMGKVLSVSACICLVDLCSTGMPLPLNLYTFRDGPTGAGGVDGG